MLRPTGIVDIDRAACEGCLLYRQIAQDTPVIVLIMRDGIDVYDFGMLTGLFRPPAGALSMVSAGLRIVGNTTFFSNAGYDGGEKGPIL